MCKEYRNYYANGLQQYVITIRIKLSGLNNVSGSIGIIEYRM